MKKLFICCITLSFLIGCTQKIPKDALVLPQESLQNRQMQTRIFETTNNQVMLSAASSVMQDLGFTLEEAEYKLGVITGSKRRDATSGGQIAGAIFIAIFTGVSTPVDKEQFIRVSMVMRSLDPQPTDTAVENKNVSMPVPVKKTKKRGAKVQKEIEIPQVEVKESGRSTVRVIFQRVIFNTAGQARLAEQINDPEIYTTFFDKLSKSVFLEAHQI